MTMEEAMRINNLPHISLAEATFIFRERGEYKVGLRIGDIEAMLSDSQRFNIAYNISRTIQQVSNKIYKPVSYRECFVGNFNFDTYRYIDHSKDIEGAPNPEQYNADTVPVQEHPLLITVNLSEVDITPTDVFYLQIMFSLGRHGDSGVDIIACGEHQIALSWTTQDALTVLMDRLTQ